MKSTALAPELRMALHVRAELLFELITDAESNGASLEVIDQFLTEELDAMQTRLGEMYSPDRVEAIVDELLVTYQRIQTVDFTRVAEPR